MPRPALLVISSGQAASLTFLIYDICITFDDEVNSIWSKPNGSWIKWQFLFTRYFALAAQITNRIIDHFIVSHIDIANTAVMNWFLCQVVLASVLLLAVELVLMARVYALYNKNIWVAFGFVFLILGKVTIVVVGVVMNMPGEQFDVLSRNPSAYILIGICDIVSQVTILSLTLIKYWTSIREGWGAVPIMTLVVRDGIVTFSILIIATTWTVVAPCTQHDYAPIANSWLLSIAACAGCRLIINMQHVSGQSERATTIELTTLSYEA